MFNTDSNKDQTLSSVFEGEGNLLPAAEQTDLIQRVRAGDSDAFVTLAATHARTFRKQRGIAVKAGVERDEAEEIILLAFTEAVMLHDLDKHPGALAAYVTKKVIEFMDRHYAQNNTPFTISRTNFNRYKSVLNKCGGDILKAYDAVAGDPDFPPDTLLAIYRATGGFSLDDDSRLHGGDSDSTTESIIAGARPVTRIVDDSYAEAEDKVLVKAAFDAVNDEEERIIALHFGFRGVQDDEKGINYAQGEVIPDLVVAQVVGMSRPTVNRRRAAGLTKMRKALQGPRDAD